MTKTTTPARTILAPGLEISRIVTGLWQVADMERDGNTLDPVQGAADLAEYARAGFDTFDMADHYGSAEVITGTLLASPNRPSVRAFTKWCPTPGPMTAAVVREGVERALHRLQTSCIDLMQFHWWTFDDPRYIDAMLELARLREEGLIAHLGLTNFDTAHLRVLLNEGIPIATNRANVRPLPGTRRAPADLRRHGRRISKRTLARCARTRRYQRLEQDEVQPLHPSYRRMAGITKRSRSRARHCTQAWSVAVERSRALGA
jgi:aryl-alcohol dehydrogenase-like predicted oxidoreductase